MHEKEVEEVEEKAGYLVIRIRTGCGLLINDNIEIRISAVKSKDEIQIAIRAPKSVPIRKMK